MSIAQNLSKLGLGVNAQGVLSAAKGGTGGSSGSTGSGGPKITNIQVTDSGYSVLDDTAVDVAGGYIKILGSGFAAGCQVLVGTTTVTSVTFVSSSEVRAQVPATAAGTYIVYLVNSDGGVAIRVNGINFSTTPTWTTSSPITSDAESVLIQLAATGAASYSLANGSTLPSGLTLTSTGLISGSVAGVTQETTYNFTVVATDSELQDSPQTFALTITFGDPYFNYTTLLLSANGSNNAANNTFLDSSSNNFAVTRSGNTTQGTFSPYGANWSNYFDGSGDYLSIPSTTALQFGTGDFTVESWVYLTATPSAQYAHILGRTEYGTNADWMLQITNANKLTFYLGTSLAFIVTSTASISLNTWTHVAATRSGNSVKLFINGVVDGITTNAGSTEATGSGAYTIGADQAGDEVLLTGYLSNIRAVKGIAVYTNNFTPSTAPLTAITNTSLLTCQSNSFKDNSVNNLAITKTGDVSVQRFSPFSPTTSYSAGTIGGSGYFDGIGDYLTTQTSTAFNFGTGDFSIEFWVYLTNSSATTQTIMGVDASASTGSIQVWYNNTANKITFNVYGNPQFVSNSTVSTNNWTHLAFTRSSGTFKMFINGIQEASGSMTNNLPNNVFVVGRGYASIDTEYFYGYVSNLRVVKGTAVYTSNFTPPSVPLAAISNTSLLLNMTNAGIYDATMINNLETVGDAKISTVQSKFGGSSLYFDGTGDGLVIPASNALAPLTGDYTYECWVYPTTSINTYKAIFGIDNYGGSTPFRMYQYGESFQFWYTGSNSINSPTISVNSWHHLAVTRTNGVVKFYINGIEAGSVTSTLNYPPSIFRIGIDLAGSYPFVGYIDDLRITRGYARYTANFTPPTAAHPPK